MSYREFVDAEGRPWRAWDTRPHSAANVRPRFAAGWLTFESGGERRRREPIPAQWADAELPALLEWLAAAEPWLRVGAGELPRAVVPPAPTPPEPPPAPLSPEGSRERTLRTVANVRALLGGIGPSTEPEVPR